MSLPRVLGIALVLGSAALLVTSCGDDGGTNGSLPGDGGTGGDGDTLPDGAPAPTRSEFGLDVRPSNTTCKAPARPPSTVPVTFQRVYQNVNLSARWRWRRCRAIRRAGSSRSAARPRDRRSSRSRPRARATRPRPWRPSARWAA